jgi:hypothetical protein
MGDMTSGKYLNLMDHVLKDFEPQNSLTLMVGDATRLQSVRPQITSKNAIFFIEYSDLTPQIFKAFNPTVVLSPAMSNSFDCLDLAEFLTTCSYTGQYRISLKSIPYPEIILREVRQKHPHLDFDIMHDVTHVNSSPLMV